MRKLTVSHRRGDTDQRAGKMVAGCYSQVQKSQSQTNSKALRHLHPQRKYMNILIKVNNMNTIKVKLVPLRQMKFLRFLDIPIFSICIPQSSQNCCHYNYRKGIFHFLHCVAYSSIAKQHYRKNIASTWFVMSSGIMGRVYRKSTCPTVLLSTEERVACMS